MRAIHGTRAGAPLFDVAMSTYAPGVEGTTEKCTGKHGWKVSHRGTDNASHIVGQTEYYLELCIISVLCWNRKVIGKKKEKRRKKKLGKQSNQAI